MHDHDPCAVNSLIETLECDPSTGRVVWDPAHSHAGEDGRSHRTFDEKRRSRSAAMKDQHVLASVMSSFWGAGLFTVLGFVSVALSEHDPIPLNKIGYAIGNVLVFAPLIFAVALLAFLAATLTLGRPAAWLLRRLMLDKPFPAALSGSALASIAAYALSRLTGSSYGWGDLAALIGPALSGGTAGLIYRRTLMPPRRPPAPPS